MQKLPFACGTTGPAFYIYDYVLENVVITEQVYVQCQL